jgi:hypothetical protein
MRSWQSSGGVLAFPRTLDGERRQRQHAWLVGEGVQPPSLVAGWVDHFCDCSRFNAFRQRRSGVDIRLPDVHKEGATFSSEFIYNSPTENGHHLPHALAPRAGRPGRPGAQRLGYQAGRGVAPRGVEAAVSNYREAPRAAEHGQTRRARPGGDASQEDTTDTGDEPVAVGARWKGEREREYIATRAEP